MDGIKQQGVYKLVDRPAGVKCIPLIWVFKIKQPKAGELIGRFKARCCLLGNVMEQSDQSYASPTPKLSTLRYALSWAAKTGAAVWSADVEQAFSPGLSTLSRVFWDLTLREQTKGSF